MSPVAKSNIVLQVNTLDDNVQTWYDDLPVKNWLNVMKKYTTSAGHFDNCSPGLKVSKGLDIAVSCWGMIRLPYQMSVKHVTFSFFWYKGWNWIDGEWGMKCVRNDNSDYYNLNESKICEGLDRNEYKFCDS